MQDDSDAHLFTRDVNDLVTSQRCHLKFMSDVAGKGVLGMLDGVV